MEQQRKMLCNSKPLFEAMI